MNKIPGFRSGTKWKKVVATIGYLFMFSAIYGMFNGNDAKTTKTTTAPVSATVTEPAKTSEQIAKEKADADAAQLAKDKAVADAKVKAEADAKAKADADAEAKAIPGTIGLKPDEFKDKWNAGASAMDIPDLKISKINVETGSVQDIFKYQFNDSYGLLGTVNKADGSIRDVIVIAGGKGLTNPKTAANAILSWGVLIQTTNPNLSPTERGNVMRDVGALGDNVNYKDVDKSTVRGNIKYHLQGSEVLGIMFSAGDVNDSKQP